MSEQRGCARRGEQEVTELEYGMDFREPRYRRETFLRFYEFHLKHRAHPGAVYYLMPYLAERHGWDTEERLWFAFLNGNTQHPVTSWILFREFPSIHGLDAARLVRWWGQHGDRCEFDTDRRYWRKAFVQAVLNYRELLRGRSQAEAFQAMGGSGGAQEAFQHLWAAKDRFHTFGRLSMFSYLEYLRIMGLEIECDRLFLDDLHGSKSHRNGLCKVFGRDDLDWHESNPGFDGRYTPAQIAWFTSEAAELLREAQERFRGRAFERDVGYFTLESALCTYKSWHRPNRRYPNVYNDMLHGRITRSEARWGERFDEFWQARRETLPTHLRLEDNPADCGLKPEKQNYYLRTGEPVMMDEEWPCFRNGFNDAVRAKQGGGR